MHRISETAASEKLTLYTACESFGRPLHVSRLTREAYLEYLAMPRVVNKAFT